jgi:hypothetical protein
MFYYGPHAIRHRRLNYSGQRMERGKTQNMKRRGKDDGVNKRNAGDKSK